MNNKIIIDTDPGIDDALALACAFNAPEIDVIALTTIFGNASVQQTTENALRILEIFEQDIPVYSGAHRPLTMQAKEYPAFVHGENGLGNIPQPKAKKQAEAISAAQFIVNTTNQFPNEITIIALGPLTNLALALALDASIAQKIKRVITMGGNLHVAGNVSAAAEANVYCDPHAADQVYTAGWPVSVVGLDVTHQIRVKNSFFEKLEQKLPEKGKFLNVITQFYMNFYQDSYIMEGCHVHDSSAIACAIHPEWFVMESGQVRVICEGECMGKLMLHHDTGYTHRVNPWQNKPIIDVAVNVNVKAVKNWLEDLF
ncbi:nucleoside hydrolase [Parashewanella spongiae]|uniref:Nucleoside hydrolase n=1 Tax=Parashewanella spongiae TaxID=342950 RepID=A0A3A6THQ0_9GAMM|nr:nucleoside hydrolase [Parashewanella spongiae]MCL1078670.1 nucleoside hydrolase [Parashewanella spongiae]RJY12957.1 nucleoside hydrolase [Parashewanella spongiae]